MNKKKTYRTTEHLFWGVFTRLKVPISYANMTTESWTARTYNRNWMSQLRDDVRLSELSIPGHTIQRQQLIEENSVIM